MANEERPCPCDIGDKFEYGGLGQEIQIEHIKAYICKPPLETDRAVIVIQDIYGWALSNTRYIVDMLAANGYIAICPDYFFGREPWTPSSDWSTFEEWIKTRPPRESDKETNVTLKYLKEQCNAKKIGVVGFCWGGIVTHHLMLMNPEIKAGVSNYGIIRNTDGICALKNPTLFIFAENDFVIPFEQGKVRRDLDAHRRQLAMTGGGPTPELTWLPWEQIAMAYMDEETLHGVGPVDHGDTEPLNTGDDGLCNGAET